jgi:DNA replicative helicase MCM subunit Mcm2 (Cdc46/Mcm family)
MGINIEWENMKKLSLKPELLDDILEETEELIKIFVTSIKTAEKKKK